MLRHLGLRDEAIRLEQGSRTAARDQSRLEKPSFVGLIDGGWFDDGKRCIDKSEASPQNDMGIQEENTRTEVSVLREPLRKIEVLREEIVCGQKNGFVKLSEAIRKLDEGIALLCRIQNGELSLITEI